MIAVGLTQLIVAGGAVLIAAVIVLAVLVGLEGRRERLRRHRAEWRRRG